MTKVSCASRIRQGMEFRNLKQADLCSMTGINKSTMSQYLSGVYEPSQIKVELLARALGVDEAWLMGYDVPMEKSASKKVDSLDDFQYALYNETKDVSDATKQSILAFIKYAKSLEEEEAKKKDQ